MRCGALEAADELDFDYPEMKEIHLLFSQNTGVSGTESMPKFRFDYAPLGLDPEWHLSAGKGFNH
jgi:hypothetical protein